MSHITDELILRGKKHLIDIAKTLIIYFDLDLDSDFEASLVKQEFQIIFKCLEDGNPKFEDAILEEMIKLVSPRVKDQRLALVCKALSKNNANKVFRTIDRKLQDPDSYIVVIGEMLAYLKIEDPELADKIEKIVTGADDDTIKIFRSINRGLKDPDSYSIVIGQMLSFLRIENPELAKEVELKILKLSELHEGFASLQEVYEEAKRPKLRLLEQRKD